MKLFGEFEVVSGGVAIPVRGAKQRALLALLALNRGNPVSADRLIDQLWGDGQTAKPVNALAGALTPQEGSRSSCPRQKDQEPMYPTDVKKTGGSCLLGV